MVVLGWTTCGGITADAGVSSWLRCAAISGVSGRSLRSDFVRLLRRSCLVPARWARRLWARDFADRRTVSDVFALASRTEGSPVALIEAMSAGLPVLATSISGVFELLGGPEAAVLVDPDDLPGATAALVSLCGDAERRARIGAAAQTLVRARRSIDLEVARTESMYLELLWTAG